MKKRICWRMFVPGHNGKEPRSRELDTPRFGISHAKRRGKPLPQAGEPTIILRRLLDTNESDMSPESKTLSPVFGVPEAHIRLPRWWYMAPNDTCQTMRWPRRRTSVASQMGNYVGHADTVTAAAKGVGNIRRFRLFAV